MIRLLAFTPLIIVIIAGVFLFRVYKDQTAGPKPVSMARMTDSRAKELMDASPFRPFEDSHTRTMEKFFIEASQEVTTIREEVGLIEDQRQQLMAKMEEEQKNVQALKEALESQAGGPDIMRLKDIAAAFEDNERLLIANGKEMAKLNDQVKERAKRLKEQMDLAGGLGKGASAAAQDPDAINAQAQATMQKLQDQRERAERLREQAQEQVQRMRDAAADRRN